MAKLEIDLGTVNLAEVPEQHRQEAERRARQAFVLVLLEQGDVSVVQAAEVLGIERKEVVKLAAASSLSNADSPRLGLWPEDRTYISRQALLFDKMRSELASQYLGKWVLFEEGKVLDADEEHKALLKRVSETGGNKIVFISKVELQEPQPVPATSLSSTSV